MNVGKADDATIKISNLKKGRDLKQQYSKEVNIPSSKKLRLFCVGQEIEDTEPLHKYSFSNNFVIIVLLVK